MARIARPANMSSATASAREGAGPGPWTAVMGVDLATHRCACGYLGDDRIACRCREGEVRAYLNRLSGPLPDRIDLQVEVGRGRSMICCVTCRA